MVGLKDLMQDSAFFESLEQHLDPVFFAAINHKIEEVLSNSSRQEDEC